MNLHDLRNLQEWNSEKTVVAVAIVLLLLAGLGLGARASEPGDFLYPLRAYLSGEVSYVIDVSHEIALLEGELADVASQLEDGSLSPEEAEDIRTGIEDRVTRINQMLENVDRAELTPHQRAQLTAALAQLSSILTRYRDSLVSLEEVAGASISNTSNAKLNPRGSSRPSRSSILEIVEGALAGLEEYTGEESEYVALDETASSTEEAMEETSEEETTPPAAGTIVPPLTNEGDVALEEEMTESEEEAAMEAATTTEATATSTDESAMEEATSTGETATSTES